MFINTSSNSVSEKSRSRRVKILDLSATYMIIFAGLGISFDLVPSFLNQAVHAQVVQAGRNTEIRTTNGRSYSFFPGQEWRTPSGYRFVFQRDKNLVLYNRSNRAIWAVGSERMDARKFTVQSDGNVVLYNGANRPIWATNTSGNRNAYFAIQDDGNLVVYSSTKKVLWTSNTSGGRNSGIFNAASRWQSGNASRQMETVLKNFFSNRANTNNENWSGKSLTEMWDRIGGESAQFPGGAYTNGDRWQKDMPSEVYQVYKDLSTAILGSVRVVTAGYAYD